MQRILFGLFLILNSSFAFTQKLWTLEECVTYAVENNIQVKKAELNQKVTEYSLLQSKLNFLPSVNASTGYYFNFGKTIDPTTNLFVTQNTQTNSLSINAGLGLFSGMQKWNALKQSEFDLLASQANTENVIKNIELYGVGGFLDIVYAKENLKVAEDQLVLSQEQLTRTRRLVESGALPQSSLYDIEAQAAQSEAARVTAQNTLDLARLNLTQLLNLSEPIDIAVPEINMEQNIAQLNVTVNDVYNIALNTQPQIRGAEYQLKSAEKGLSVAKGRLYPTLSLFGSLSTNYSDLYKRFSVDSSSLTQYTVGYLSTDFTPVVNFTPLYITRDVPLDQQYKDNFGQAFGFTLDIPIFNNWQIQNTVSRSKMSVLDAEYNLDAARQQLLKDVQTAYADAVAAKNSYDAALKGVASLDKSFADAQLKFDSGLITSLDFTTVKSNYVKAQSELLKAKYQYIFKLKVLDFYQGKPLTLQ